MNLFNMFSTKKDNNFNVFSEFVETNVSDNYSVDRHLLHLSSSFKLPQQVVEDVINGRITIEKIEYVPFDVFSELRTVDCTFITEQEKTCFFEDKESAGKFTKIVMHEKYTCAHVKCSFDNMIFEQDSKDENKVVLKLKFSQQKIESLFHIHKGKLTICLL